MIKLLDFLLATVLLLTGLTTAAPTSTSSAVPSTSSAATCDAKVFDIPWVLTGITLYQPDTTTTNSTQQGWIRFNFMDYNDRLQLETACFANTTNGTVDSLDGGYAMCANTEVAFKLGNGGMLMVERAYRDKCLGQWPYNFGIAFGQNQTSMPTPIPGPAGALRVQDQLEVQITAMA